MLASTLPFLAAKRIGIAAPALADPERETLKSCHWPGNIRELQNVGERTVILARGEPLCLDLALSDWVKRCALAQPARGAAAAAREEIVPEIERRNRERDNIQAARMKIARSIA